jgi:hypothetical protein
VQLALSDGEFDALEYLREFLRPISDLASGLSSADFTTASVIIPALNNLMDHLQEAVSSPEVQTVPARRVYQHAAKLMLDTLLQHYQKTTLTTMLLTALDPRCRREYFELLFSDEALEGDEMILHPNGNEWIKALDNQYVVLNLLCFIVYNLSVVRRMFPIGINEY